jgi:hypothetical protein
MTHDDDTTELSGALTKLYAAYPDRTRRSMHQFMEAAERVCRIMHRINRRKLRPADDTMLRAADDKMLRELRAFTDTLDEATS